LKKGLNLNSDPSSAEAVVQQQLDAYNARDIDAFMLCWSEDCAHQEFPSRLFASGKLEIRKRHVERFKENNPHGRLIKRIAVADLVVDQEVVTRSFPEGPGEVDVIAIYEIRGGVISGAWFKTGKPRLYPVVV